ncbi:hypothetical protein M405DRAFT_338529 [Rhizopogon salebrosus TDB-379]|nr:hypothetical protein M405DRAFT_338529 [Rhizopogon salebrosus TDB-379]
MEILKITECPLCNAKLQSHRRRDKFRTRLHKGLRTSLRKTREGENLGMHLPYLQSCQSSSYHC